jgi:hypothetical protein
MIFTECPYCQYPVCFQYNPLLPGTVCIVKCGDGVEHCTSADGAQLDPCGKHFWATNTNLPGGKSYPIGGLELEVPVQ